MAQAAQKKTTHAAAKSKPSSVSVQKSVKVTSHRTVEAQLSPQGQRLVPTITQQICGANGISAGLVVMPPSKTSRPHFHRNNEMIVVVIEGYAATLIGEEMEPIYHGPGEFIFIPEGVIHTAVNLSTTKRLVAIEVRTDPHFNDDVVVLPELEEKVAATAAHLHKHFGTPKLSTPEHWDVSDFGPFTFAE